MMKKFIYGKLRFHFAIITCVATFVSLTVFSTVLYALNSYFNWDIMFSGRFYVWVFLIILSGMISAFITTYVGLQIIEPIEVLRENMTKVSAGDFTVELDPEQKVEEVSQLYRDFNLMVHELGGIDALQNNFVSTVSHEFKTPLATIQGYAQLLQDPEIDDDTQQDLSKRLIVATQQLTQLTDNILKLTKIEHQGISLERKIIRIDEQIRQALLFLQAKWEKYNISFNIILERTQFEGNEELMQQVWVNLLDNAIKYNHQDGEITITQHELEDGRIGIDISDTGIGMTPETVNRIFDKFYQADSSRLNSGNGLGLSLVKQILKLHQAEIKYKSSLGQGTTVTVILPKHTKASD